MNLNQELDVQQLEDQNEEVRICWICFGTDDDNTSLTWVRPCKCRGSGKWVHETCLFVWVDEKMSDNTTSKISCPQCTTEYIIIVPKNNALTTLFQMLDRFANRTCPILTAGIVVTVLYWSASSYGAFTVMQIYGEEKGLNMLENCELNTLMLFLPMIPISLIVIRIVPWEDAALNVLRRCSRYPFLNYILPSLAYNEVMGERVYIMPQTTNVSSTRVFVGALLLPSIARVIGHIFFQHEQSCLKRFLLGGLSFLIIKGVMKMCHRHMTYRQKCHRKIKNYDETNLPNNSPITST